MTRRRTSNVWAAALVAVATVATLGGCAAAGAVVAPTLTSAPPVSQPVALRVPAATPGDLVRLVYVTASDPQEASATVPSSSTGFSIEAGCSSADTKAKFVYSVTSASGGAPITASGIPCNSTHYLDTALLPGVGQQVRVTMTGNLVGVRKAYVILEPSP
jgi:hypothetical protein